MDNPDTWPPIHGTGWIRAGRPAVQRRTGHQVADTRIQDLIEQTAADPSTREANTAEAWRLYRHHGRAHRRIGRETRALLDALAYLVLWIIVGMLVVIGSTYLWGAE